MKTALKVNKKEGSACSMVYWPSKIPDTKQQSTHHTSQVVGSQSVRVFAGKEETLVFFFSRARQGGGADCVEHASGCSSECFSGLWGEDEF